MAEQKNISPNPYKPGAGHTPPYLAGRTKEITEFIRLIDQTTILENLVLTGLRGVGKTVLLEEFRSLALPKGWSWVGSDLSETASISEENIATRLLTDLAVATSTIVVESRVIQQIGFEREPSLLEYKLNYDLLWQLYQATPGLVSDKLKKVLEFVWQFFGQLSKKGLLFVYDEAQNLADHREDRQYPLSLLLDVFQSIQRKDIPFMLVLTGLPTLFPKLVESRTFSERMFRVIMLKRLNETESREAIQVPMKKSNLAWQDRTVAETIRLSGGYPYFIQFICREVFDLYVSGLEAFSMEDIVRKLDSDFFAGRWSRVTDRQRDLLYVIADLSNCDEEFTVQEIVEQSKRMTLTSFGASHVTQMLNALGNAGLVYKNRHGRYSFAVPLLGEFINRQKKLLKQY